MTQLSKSQTSWPRAITRLERVQLILHLVDATRIISVVCRSWRIMKKVIESIENWKHSKRTARCSHLTSDDHHCRMTRALNCQQDLRLVQNWSDLTKIWFQTDPMTTALMSVTLWTAITLVMNHKKCHLQPTSDVCQRSSRAALSSSCTVTRSSSGPRHDKWLSSSPPRLTMNQWCIVMRRSWDDNSCHLPSSHEHSTQWLYRAMRVTSLWWCNAEPQLITASQLHWAMLMRKRSISTHLTCSNDASNHCQDCVLRARTAIQSLIITSLSSDPWMVISPRLLTLCKCWVTRRGRYIWLLLFMRWRRKKLWEWVLRRSARRIVDLRVSWLRSCRGCKIRLSRSDSEIGRKVWRWQSRYVWGIIHWMSILTGGSPIWDMLSIGSM